MDAIIPRNSRNQTLMGSSDDRSSKTKKRGGVMRIVRAALYVIRAKAKSNSVQVDAASKLTSFMGSMRPLHMQSNQSPPRFIEGGFAGPVVQETANHTNLEPYDGFTPFMSPAHESVASYGSSQYASVLSFQDLDRCDEIDNEKYEENWHAENCEDEMIDERAEEFIARFYEQMRLQDQAYRNRHMPRV
ncbi:hypothetical protein K2173_010212 [Erythroxylum novogranatense]|uniref:Uncharacterized protein n=1 Tax=Erythroxylum novogranatense TaxID=1862640 RepID=A0AAV8U9B9_9ROSI|nr:hypothetical protein K2173_010212 [Erythroxylum novogranatense]